MVHHGIKTGVKFRYVWAKPKDNWKMRYHIARKYQGKIAQGTYNDVRGKTYFVGCHSYGDTWRNYQVTTREFKDIPPHAARCWYCENNIEDFEGKIFSFADGGKNDTTPIYRQFVLIKKKEWKRWHLAVTGSLYKDTFWICCRSTIDPKYSPAFDHLDVIPIENNVVPMPYHEVCYRCRIGKKELVKYLQFKTTSEPAREEADAMTKAVKENPMEINPGLSDEDLPVFTSMPRADEEDIDPEPTNTTIETAVTGRDGIPRDSIPVPHVKCSRCKRCYAISNTTYIPLDGTGIKVETFVSYYERPPGQFRFGRIYSCVCGHPMRIQITTEFETKYVMIGKPVVK